MTPNTQILFESAMAILSVVRTATAEGRDPTPEELNAMDVDIAKRRREIEAQILARPD